MNKNHRHNGKYAQNLFRLLEPVDKVLLAARMESEICCFCKSNSHLRCNSGRTRKYEVTSRNSNKPVIVWEHYPSYCACWCHMVADEARQTALSEAFSKLWAGSHAEQAV